MDHHRPRVFALLLHNVLYRGVVRAQRAAADLYYYRPNWSWSLSTGRGALIQTGGRNVWMPLRRTSLVMWIVATELGLQSHLARVIGGWV
jgi:hypothetical protein